MISFRRLSAYCSLALLLTLTGGVRAANNSEQLIFSGTAGPVGFWIWCEVESGNSYVTECNGAMYFYNLGITKHVIDSAPLSEGPEGIYTIHVASTDGDAVSCTLMNTSEAVHGPHNTVSVSCTNPSVSVSTSSAVVVVTGPPE